MRVPFGCTRPSGRVRIETSGLGSNGVCWSGCTRPSGRVRIETSIDIIEELDIDRLHPSFGTGED